MRLEFPAAFPPAAIFSLKPVEPGRKIFRLSGLNLQASPLLPASRRPSRANGDGLAQISNVAARTSLRDAENGKARPASYGRRLGTFLEKEASTGEVERFRVRNPQSRAIRRLKNERYSMREWSRQEPQTIGSLFIFPFPFRSFFAAATLYCISVPGGRQPKNRRSPSNS